MMAKKLLLSDDSQTIQKVVELVLGPEGFEIKSYGNGAEALNALESVMPDLVLADIEMPGLNGYQLCEQLKGNARTQHIPLILLAGAFEPFDEDYMRSVGADDCIIKPFESHELLSKVNSLLAQADIGEPSSAMVQIPAPAVTEAADTITAGQNEWFEAPHFPAAGETRPDGKDFEEELKESMRILEEEWKHELPPEPAPMSIEEISKMVKDAVGVRDDTPAERLPAEPLIRKDVPVIDTRAVEDIVRDSVKYLTESISPVIEETVRTQIAGILPGILEEGLKKNLAEMTGPLQGLISAEIKRVVPELAERIIRREIEKITSELA